MAISRSYTQAELINELGNRICMSIGDSHSGGVEITISGPDSLIENELTLTETYALYEAIGQYLDQRQANTPGN